MDTRPPVKVLIIEDHPLVRDGCQYIFKRRPDIETAEASTASEGLAMNKTFQPNVIVLDIVLQDTAGLDILPTLLADNPKAAIIILSMYGTRSLVMSALEDGATGYITKNDDPNSLLTAIDKVRNGETYLGQAVAQMLAMSSIAPSHDPLQDLNERERQVIALFGEGRSLTEISVDLNLGYKTVANTVSLIKQKLNIVTTTALVKFAVEYNLKKVGPGGGLSSFGPLLGVEPEIDRIDDTTK
jgi:two-component system, NarL family, invasion response regulator UvrY